MKKSFTLIELIVVIAIIAILGAVIAPNAFKAISKAKVAATVADFRSIKTAVMTYLTDTAAWPLTTAGSAYFLANTGSVANWDGPYLDKWPQSRWGTGVYSFQNDSTVDWTGAAPGDAAKYAQITLVPQASAQKIDLAVDGAVNSGAGSFRYTAADPTTVYYLVSTDVTVN